jgi:2-polyprenyl-3-methyl-5-hydroxy-6-metoxy-1,4-benzoquinol methylase
VELNVFMDRSGGHPRWADGHYAQKQLFSRSRLVAWSHASRFEMARQLVAPRAGQRLLDYGCGDGTFVAQVHDLFPSATAVDVSSSQLRDCARRFASLEGLIFAHVDHLDENDAHAAFDVVTCMEVLEHCPDRIQIDVLDRIARVTAVDGLVIISAPIEVGPSLAAKHLARSVVAMRGLTEYTNGERYRMSEFARMLFARRGTAIVRDEQTAIDEEGRVSSFTGHKGFNWRSLEVLIGRRFIIEHRLFTPMRLMGPMLNSQVWFVCRKLSN